MTSQINPNWPQAQQAKTANVRQNFAAAKSEIEELQAKVEELQAAVSALQEAMAGGEGEWAQLGSSATDVDFGEGNMPTPWTFFDLDLVTEHDIGPADVVTVTAALMVREVSGAAAATLEIGLSVNGADPGDPVSTKIIAASTSSPETMVFSATGLSEPAGTTLSVAVRRGMSPDKRTHLVLPGSVAQHRLILRGLPAKK